MRRRVLILGAIALAVLGTSTPAQARRFRLPIGAGLRAARKSYGVSHLTQAQLEQCLVQGKDLDAMEGSTSQGEARLGKMQLDLESLYERLEVEGRQVDQYSQTSVDAYNVSVSRYELARGQFNDAVDRHNTTLQDFNSAVSNYNAACADRLYYEDDMAAARTAVGVPD